MIRINTYRSQPNGETLGRLTPLRDSVRSTLKELVWLTTSYEQGRDPNICLFATRRGGSTWLMEVIAANRGVRSLDQPFEILTPNLTPTHYRLLPKFDAGQLVRPDETQEAELRRFVDRVMSGEFSANAPYAFWRRDFARKANRLVLKIVDAKAMMDWFDRSYHARIVYLVRHPVPQSLSCLRNNWGLTARAYLRNEWFAEEVLGPDLMSSAESVLGNGSELETMVLNWVLENFYPLKVIRDRPHWICLSYEECVRDRTKAIETLALRLNLADKDRMAAAASSASRSSGHSTQTSRSAVERGDTTRQLEAWLGEVSRDDAQRCRSVLQRFGISLYDVDDPMPRWDEYRVRTGTDASEPVGPVAR
jgi:hypothetical protein